MKALSIQTSAEALSAEMDGLNAIDPTIVIAFLAPQLFSDGTIEKLQQALPSCHLIGCSTSGEIGREGVMDNTLSLLAIRFDKTELVTASVPLQSNDASYASGKAIAEKLKKPGLKCIFTLSPGVNVNGSQYVKGITDNVPKDVIVTGGLAGDGVNFTKTFTVLDGNVSQDHVIAFGLYGDHIEIGSGSKGGWSVFGPSRRVTKAKANMLYELDGKPALALYKEYLGEKADDLPSSGLFYPLAILREDYSSTGLIRTILNVDHEEGSLTLAGDLPEGSLVCLMHADTDLLTHGAEDAATACGSSEDGAAILVSCVGRKLIMADDVEEEVEAVRDILGAAVPLAGFYSYGEIGPFAETGMSELHNQTMTITYLREKLVA